MTARAKHFREVSLTGEPVHANNAGRFFRTFEEVGRILGISRQAAHQAERRAIHKLRLAFLDELAEQNPQLTIQFLKGLEP